MKLIGTFEVPRTRQRQWKNSELQQGWAASYPELFDELDLELATHKQQKFGYHFFEWLGAIILFRSTGFHALVSKYQIPKHERKRAVVKALHLDKLLFAKLPEFGGTLGPDLLMYAPSSMEYFFCEVKSPDDRVSDEQVRYFQHLERQTGQPIRLLRFKWAGDQPAEAITE